jgi:F-type H+-transporting ATP synthase subunit e
MIRQVVRYTALASGIVYGIVHRRTLFKQDILHKEQAAEKQRDSWISQAKKAYKEKVERESQSPLQRLTGGKKNEGAPELSTQLYTYRES